MKGAPEVMTASDRQGDTSGTSHAHLLQKIEVSRNKGHGREALREAPPALPQPLTWP